MTPTMTLLTMPVHLNRMANLRANQYAPNAVPRTSATPERPTGIHRWPDTPMDDRERLPPVILGDS